MEKTIKFDYLIVPCPGDPSFKEDKVEFFDIEDKLYLGAEDRMKAATMIARDAEKVILVGGSQSKVVAMFIYFKKEMKKFGFEDNDQLICLVSKPGSTGNLSAFKKYYNRGGNKEDTVAIISNYYHLPRLKLIWKSLFPEKIILEENYISAEEILGEGTKDQLHEKELRHRRVTEEAGRRDWRNNSYDNQDKIETWDNEFWKCEELMLDFKILPNKPI